MRELTAASDIGGGLAASGEGTGSTRVRSSSAIGVRENERERMKVEKPAAVHLRMLPHSLCYVSARKSACLVSCCKPIMPPQCLPCGGHVMHANTI